MLQLLHCAAGVRVPYSMEAHALLLPVILFTINRSLYTLASKDALQGKSSCPVGGEMEMLADVMLKVQF